MDKFVANFDRRARNHPEKREELLQRIKGYFGPDQLKAYKVLTDEFAISGRRSDSGRCRPKPMRHASRAMLASPGDRVP